MALFSLPNAVSPFSVTALVFFDFWMHLVIRIGFQSDLCIQSSDLPSVFLSLLAEVRVSIDVPPT